MFPLQIGGFSVRYNEVVSLVINPKPLYVVPDARRDVWFKQQGWRCEHEDGRGRCTSRDTTTRWNADERRGESYCAAHVSPL